MDFTYPEVGATREGVLPAGYSHLDSRTELGRGPEVFRRPAESLMAFRMHRAIRLKISASSPRALARGHRALRRAAASLMTFRMHPALPVKITTSSPRATEGAAVTVTLAWLLKAPCRMIWTEDGERTAGWAYGTLKGHPEAGE